MTVVREFHVETGQLVNDTPTVVSAEDVRHRMRLIREEYEEVMAELGKLTPPPPSGPAKYRIDVLQAVLKELADLRYVIEGTAVAFGLPLEAAYAAVHASNMTKRFPDGTFHVSETGKVLKGPNYQPPDMNDFVPPIIEDVVATDDDGITAGDFKLSFGEGVRRA